MPPLKPLAFRVVQRKLEAAGFAEIGQKGSHIKFGNQTPQGFRTVIVPHHKEIGVGTLQSILRQAGLTRNEFETL